MQAKLIAKQNNLNFDEKRFNFSTKWLHKFKKINNVTRLRFHGEGEDADMDSVAIVREELPRVLTHYPLEKIYNFDETGMYLAPPQLCVWANLCV